MQDVADSCRTGAATDIIFGLALGYKSAILPCFVIAICIYVSFSLANMYGIACAALGMLTTMSTGVPGIHQLRGIVCTRCALVSLNACWASVSNMLSAMFDLSILIPSLLCWAGSNLARVMVKWQPMEC